MNNSGSAITAQKVPIWCWILLNYFSSDVPSQKVPDSTVSVSLFRKPVLWIQNNFFPNPDPTFQWFRIRILFRILHKFVLLFLTWILPLYSCYVSVFGCSMLNLSRYKLFRGIFFWLKGIYIFKLSIFVEKLSKCISFSEKFKFISDPDAEWFFRIRILQKVSDPLTGSGSWSCNQRGE